MFQSIYQAKTENEVNEFNMYYDSLEIEIQGKTLSDNERK